MIRKSTAIRMTFLALLAVLASFGVFNVTARPAHALTCAPKTLGCFYSHMEDFGTYVCCMYQCPDGTTRQGTCQPI